MDFQVEAKVHVRCFRDEQEVLRLLRSHGFELTDLGQGQVLVQGSYQKLKNVKARLDCLMETPPPPPPSSSGAISKHYGRNGGGGRPLDSGSRNPGSRHRSPEELVVDSDVFRYARRFRRRELEDLWTRQDLQVQVKEEEENTIITLRGGSSRLVFSQLQNLLDRLNRSLRTQEVLLRDVGREGERLFSHIRANNNTWSSVLVCETADRLHLIGPSKDSYELKQRLQGRPVDRSGAGGGTSPVKQSQSVPTRSRTSPVGGDDGAAAAASSNDGGQEAAAPASVWRRFSLRRRRSQSRERKPSKVPGEPRESGGIFKSFTNMKGWFKRRQKKTN